MGRNKMKDRLTNYLFMAIFIAYLVCAWIGLRALIYWLR